MAFGDNSFPDDPEFPYVMQQTDFDIVMRNTITDYLTDITAHMATISDQTGNLTFPASGGIEWYAFDFARITYSASKVQFESLQVAGDFSYDTLVGGDDCTVDNDLTVAAAATLTVNSALQVLGVTTVETWAMSSITLEQTAEPDYPTEHGVSYMWCDNGVAYGAGDIVIKTRYGDQNKSKVLVDFSEV